jgi:hypothetical protein
MLDLVAPPRVRMREEEDRELELVWRPRGSGVRPRLEHMNKKHRNRETHRNQIRMQVENRQLKNTGQFSY